MASFLRINDDFIIQREQIAAVKPARSGKACSIFTPGQSSVDGGFLVEQKYDDVVAFLLEPELDLREAARQLLALLDEAAPKMQSMAEIANAAGHPYDGPNFYEEIENLRAALQTAD